MVHRLRRNIMGRKRSKPVEFNPEPISEEKPVAAPAPESEETPPQLEVKASKEAGEGPSGPSEPSKSDEGSLDVEGSESGSESRTEASTVGSVGDGNNEPLSREQFEANELVAHVKGDTAPTQPNPSASEMMATAIEEVEQEEAGEAPKRYRVQRAMVGVYNAGAVVDAESLSLEDDRLKLFISQGYLIPE
jgi:hypothetical protein